MHRCRALPPTYLPINLLTTIQTQARWSQKKDLAVHHAATSATVVSLANAVNVMHSRGLIHRDLKPANIMVSPFAGVFKILDWGAAHVVGRADVRFPAGTTLYMPPERMVDFANVVPSKAEDW